VKISLGLVGEFAATERNGNSFRVHVRQDTERKRDAKKENENNVESRCASGRGSHVSIFDISICERARVFLPAWEMMRGYTRCTSLLIAHDLHHGYRSDSAEFCPPPRSRSTSLFRDSCYRIFIA